MHGEQGAELETSQYADVVVIRKTAADRERMAPPAQPAPHPIYAEIVHRPVHFYQDSLLGSLWVTVYLDVLVSFSFFLYSVFGYVC